MSEQRSHADTCHLANLRATSASNSSEEHRASGAFDEASG